MIATVRLFGFTLNVASSCEEIWIILRMMMDRDQGQHSRPKYVEAIKQTPDLGKKQHANSTFFVDAPAHFFHKYNNMFHKHVSTVVRLSDVLIYLVGGNPILARMLLQWLK